MTRTLSSLIVATAVLLHGAQVPRQAVASLRVCADPENLPFTNDRGEGFENHLANLLARDLGTTVTYTWRRQRSDFLNMTLLRGDCDIVMGYPAQVEQVATTKPYYRSTYVWVSRHSRGLRIRSYDDPNLTRLRIGVQFSGDEASSPPAQALGRRGISAGHLVGFIAITDEHASTPPSEIIQAVARGDIDVAAAWGPMAGYYAARQTVALDIAPVTPQIDGRMPQAFDISIAIRRGDPQQVARLNRFINARHAEIDALLDEYHVPRVERPVP